MKKGFTIFTVILLCFSFAACRVRETYDFLHPDDEICSVSIVDLSFDENEQLIQTEVHRVDDIVSFLQDFRTLDCYTYFGDPTGVTLEGEEDTVIKISYNNGEYELINWRGQAEYTISRGFDYYSGFSIFDETQFHELLTDYMSNAAVGNP